MVGRLSKLQIPIHINMTFTIAVNVNQLSCYTMPLLLRRRGRQVIKQHGSRHAHISSIGWKLTFTDKLIRKKDKPSSHWLYFCLAGSFNVLPAPFCLSLVPSAVSIKYGHRRVAFGAWLLARSTTSAIATGRS